MPSSETTAEFVADVRVSDALDRLVLTPRSGPAWRLKARLVELLPGVVAVTRAEGVVIEPRAAAGLLALDEALGLRWSSEARRAVENRVMSSHRHPRLRAALEVFSRARRGELEGHLAGIDDPATLDDHQVLNVAVMTHADCYGLCLFDEQGAGKTVSVIYAFDLLAHRDEVDVAVIVAPKSMVPEWASDITRFTSGMYTTRLVVGTRREKLAALRSGADILVTNFETAITLEAELRSIVRRHDGRTLLVADESFLVKNLDAQRTRALRRVREWCGRSYVLCGTPAPNSPHDIVEQVNLADLGETFNGVTIPDDRIDALPVVREALRERGAYLRSLKRDVLPGLPRKRLHVVRLPFASQQRRAYESALRSLIDDLEATSSDGFRLQLTSFMARRSALLQICSNPAALVPGYREVPAKLQALDHLLNDWVLGRREKVVVWSFFTVSLQAVVSRYESLGVVRYDGGTPVAERRQAVQRFQEDPATKLFVGNPAAAGAGLTLHAARLAVYESMSNQAAHYLQSVDRIHRRGQTRPVDYTFLICRGSIEEDEFTRLRRKERSAQELLGDPFDESPTRESMLAELVGAATRAQIDVAAA